MVILYNKAEPKTRRIYTHMHDNYNNTIAI